MGNVLSSGNVQRRSAAFAARTRAAPAAWKTPPPARGRAPPVQGVASDPAVSAANSAMDPALASPPRPARPIESPVESGEPEGRPHGPYASGPRWISLRLAGDLRLFSVGMPQRPTGGPTASPAGPWAGATLLRHAYRSVTSRLQGGAFPEESSPPSLARTTSKSNIGVCRNQGDSTKTWRGA